VFPNVRFPLDVLPNLFTFQTTNKNNKQVDLQPDHTMSQNKNTFENHNIVSQLVQDSFSNDRSAASDMDLLLFADVDPRPIEQDQEDDSSLTTLTLSSKVDRSVLGGGFLMASNPPSNVSSQFESLGMSQIPEEDARLVAPSGVAGAVVGLILGGPILAVIAGFGSAYAVRKEGSTGDIARSMGEVALSAQQTTEELEKKLHWIERTRKAVDGTESKIVWKVRRLVVSSWDSAVEYSRQHQLLERGVEGTGRGFEYLADRISPTDRTK
jgi:hypothetical protein